MLRSQPNFDFFSMKWRYCDSYLNWIFAPEGEFFLLRRFGNCFCIALPHVCVRPSKVTKGKNDRLQFPPVLRAVQSL
ncbi:MAG: hypothetical protein PHG00_16770 [Methylococcales bacterium]|nr:hypothetical protein [Methylococcales bacterium]